MVGLSVYDILPIILFLADDETTGHFMGLKNPEGEAFPMQCK